MNAYLWLPFISNQAKPSITYTPKIIPVLLCRFSYFCGNCIMDTIAMHGTQNGSLPFYILFDISIDIPSFKTVRDIFWQRVHRCKRRTVQKRVIQTDCIFIDLTSCIASTLQVSNVRPLVHYSMQKFGIGYVCVTDQEIASTYTLHQ